MVRLARTRTVVDRCALGIACVTRCITSCQHTAPARCLSRRDIQSARSPAPSVPRIIIRSTKMRECFLSCRWTSAGSLGRMYATIDWRPVSARRLSLKGWALIGPTSAGSNAADRTLRCSRSGTLRKRLAFVLWTCWTRTSQRQSDSADVTHVEDLPTIWREVFSSITTIFVDGTACPQRDQENPARRIGWGSERDVRRPSACGFATR
jgi:hypothetical protein